jgi:hypothetical protein
MIIDTKVTGGDDLVFITRCCHITHLNGKPDTTVMTRCKITFYSVLATFHKLFCQGPGKLISLDLFLSPGGSWLGQDAQADPLDAFI